ncbi:hypothetical protein C5167_019170 [Papaver somniferum]|nr:hypothetical protein C5167_019170 [Papaver somniferum]
MVCDKCEKKLSKVIVPDKWKEGASNTTEGGGRKINENKLLSKKNRDCDLVMNMSESAERWTPYGMTKCMICKQQTHQEAKYCHTCAYSKGVCAMCGKQVLDTKLYKQKLFLSPFFHQSQLALVLIKTLLKPLRKFKKMLKKSSEDGHQTGNLNEENKNGPPPPPLAEEIFKSGSYKQGDSTFYSLLMGYADSKDFVNLEIVLDRMKRERRVITEKVFIYIFKACRNAHFPDKAVYLFDRMAEFQCRQSVRSFNSVLNVLIQEGRFDQALSFYSYVVGKGIPPNGLTFNLIIKTRCRMGLIDRAIETFRDMSCIPDLYTYSTLIDGLCKENRIEEAITLLDEMQSEGCFPNEVTYNALINGLCKKGDIARASKLVENMFLKGCIPNEVTYNTLIHGLCLKGKLEKAVWLLDRMVADKCVPNHVTYGTIVNGLVEQGKVADAVLLLDSIEDRGHRPNEYIYSSVASGLFKEGNSEGAVRLWQKMIEKGFQPNTVLYSVLIDGLCRQGKPDEAENILPEMANHGCIANAFTYSSLMRGFFEAGNCGKALQIWKQMEHNGCSPNEVCFSVLIHGLCKDGKLKEGLMVWKHMLGRGCKPDVVAYSSIIHGMCEAGFVDGGLRLLNEMLCLDSNSQPDIITYNILFHGLCKQNKISRAVDLLNSMLTQGCDPDLVTCNIFLKSLAEKLNPPQDGREFLDELVVRLSKRQRVLGAAKIVEIMLQKFLPPKASTWERIVEDLCKHKKVQAAIDRCWHEVSR